MQYRSTEKVPEKLSALGFGCMRFPRRKTGAVDQQKVNEQVKLAIESGVNYFDTAYIYPGSESALGEALKTLGKRDSVYIADKLPHYLIKKPEDMERFFQEHLARLGTDRIDFYIMHMLPDLAVWTRLKELGIAEFLEKKKSEGKIKHIGFSYHGNTEHFVELLDAYVWDFAQVQYNYMDETSQAGRRGVERAAEKGMAVIIMEPLRGGRLADGLPQKAKDEFERVDSSISPAQWGLKWLYKQPEITVVLSGMNHEKQVKENTSIASETLPDKLTQAESEAFGRVKKLLSDKIRVGCTGCGYCQPCPRGVDIPGCFSAYNARYTANFFQGMKQYFMCTTLRGKPSNASLCVGCGKCEQHCPQHIKIREELKNVTRKMENPIYKVGRWGARRIYKFDK
ncbi:MAG: aldo/keto reductase [Eubacteriales bacterium]|nr:aldo/keto reductase [Eubacteriales bacterium]MDD4512778.1 aldo/keto reductase [Eubacteriales bacterium]